MPKLVKRRDIGGARRLADGQAEPAPTVMAGGIGSVNRGQYHVEGSPSLPSPAITCASPGNDTILVHGVSEPGNPTYYHGKPLYRVPSMIEIAAIPWNGMIVASTFSGCGGSCLGYRMAGFKVGWASEFVPSAADSYEANAAEGSILDRRDIKTVEADEILEALGIKKGQLDIFDGSPPCQAFSTAGKRQKGWGSKKKYEGGHEQMNEALFEHWLRLLKGLMPKAFVAENVSGMVKGVCKGVFLETLAGMKAAGYRVRAAVLDAQWLGVPQQRQRVIFVGIRDDIVDMKGKPIPPCHPVPLPWRYSVREAIPWIGISQPMQSITTVEELHGEVRERGPGKPAAAVRAGKSGGVKIVQRQGAPGIGRKDISDGQQRPTIMGSQANQFEIGIVHPSGPTAGRVDSIDQPLPAVMAQPEGVGGMGQGQTKLEIRKVRVARGFNEVEWVDAGQGPYTTVGTAPSAGCNLGASGGEDEFVPQGGGEPVRRKFSIAEVKRICAFPDDFDLSPAGGYAKQWACLGNAVPPIMMFWIARTLRDVLRQERGRRLPIPRDPVCLVARPRQ